VWAGISGGKKKKGRVGKTIKGRGPSRLARTRGKREKESIAAHNMWAHSSWILVCWTDRGFGASASNPAGGKGRGGTREERVRRSTRRRHALVACRTSDSPRKKRKKERKADTGKYKICNVAQRHHKVQSISARAQNWKSVR